MARNITVGRATAAAIVLAVGMAANLASAQVVVREGLTWTIRTGAGEVTGIAQPVSQARELVLRDGTSVLTWRQGDESWASFRSPGMPGYTHPAPNPLTLELTCASFDPLSAQPVVAPDLRAGPENTLYIVQFIVPPLDAMRQDLADSGAVIERYLPHNAYLVSMDADKAKAVASLPHVRWVGPMHPAYKIEPALRRFALEGAEGAVFALHAYSPDLDFAWLDRFDQQGERYPFHILLNRFDTAIKADVVRRIEALGGEVTDNDPDSPTRILTALLDKTQLRHVIAFNEVTYVDPWGLGGVDNDIARQIGGATIIAAVNPTPLGHQGFLGQGVRGEVYDTGIRQTHVDFQSPPVLVHGPTPPVDSHGNMAYGCVFGTGTANPQGMGLLPRASGKIFRAYQTSELNYSGVISPRYAGIGELVNPSLDWQAVFQTSSVGSNRVTTYTNISSAHDDMIFVHRLLMCQSQSNAGNQNSRPEAWAKNIVAVGGIFHNNTLDRTDDRWTTASIGPASDGRVKPDLAHFYDNVFTPTSTSDTAYGSFSGTSSATPLTAGHFGLLFQMWHEGVFSKVWNGSTFQDSGGGSSVFHSRCGFPTAKALMCNTAFRYTWGQGGNNNNITRNVQGWGMADVGALYTQRDGLFIVNESDLLVAGQSSLYEFDVPSGAVAFRATLSFADPAAAPNASIHAVNDLSLRVTAPDGTVYWGNNGLASSNFSTPGGTANTRDNVENVFLANPIPGRWAVEVIATSIVQDGWLATPAVDAAYALVVFGGAFVTPGCPGDWNGDGVVDFNDFLAYLNDYNAGLPIADLNGDGIVDFNDFLEFLNRYNTPCP
jgi:hypothetical protein